MPDFPADLLRAARRLLVRRAGQTGPLRSAYIRRSLSTSYYALFHFCLDEAALRIVGASGNLRQRRRIFVRTLSHTGLAGTFGKLRGAAIDKSVEAFFRSPGSPPGPIATPAFVRQFAMTYLDARAKREDADYDLNAPLSEADARQLHRRVGRAMRDWQDANSQADRDVKHAVAILLSLKGRSKES